MAQPLGEKRVIIQEKKPQVAKKTYIPPRLLNYGSVAKLTQGTGGTQGDGVLGMTMA